ncbi:MAG: tetratricopeptide repeat protein [Nannocystaceae bacterium]
MHELWSRVREGRHAVVVGTLPPPPPSQTQAERWAVVRIRCDGPSSTWGPVEGARRQIESLLGEQSPRWDEALDRMGTSTRLLGDLAEPTIEATLVGAANRLADRHPQRGALVFEALEAADDATVQALRDIVLRGGWLRLPLVLVVAARPEAGPLRALLDEIDGEPIACEPVPAEAEFDWSSLEPAQLMVMRAAAVIGRSFEAELVGRLLGVSVDSVLVRLQQAVDRGAPLADHGGGRLSMPNAAHARLVARVLPSLVERWHRRLGEILATPAAQSMDADVDDPRADVPEPSSAPRPESSAPEAPSAADGPVAAASNSRDYSELVEPAANEPLRTEPEAAEPDAETPPAREGAAPAAPRRRHDEITQVLEEARPAPEARDQARAAHHLSEAGLPGRAVQQYLEALRKVAARGDSRRALLIAEQALTVLERQPSSLATDLLRARVLAMAARVQWRGAGRGPALTLQGALESVDEARGLLGEQAPVELRTEIAQLIAGICYDMGDIASLQRALDALSDAARDLMREGDSTAAARLLNDQAAVYLRAGDPVRANHLLQQSRGIFDALHRTRPDDPTVIVERAETEHLLARLPLHARLRPGREEDAYSMALGHARAAAEGYRRLGGRVELGRVSETMGRLETARGRHDLAGAHIDAALQLARQLGDVTGMARGTAALADLYIAAGRPAQALGALRDSVTFNMDKGSPLGLAVNRRTLERLETAISSSPRVPSGLLSAVEELDQQLREAEAMLGRVAVPGDSD